MTSAERSAAIRELLLCPCGASLTSAFACKACERSWRVVDGVPLFLEEGHEHMDRRHVVGNTNPYSASARAVIEGARGGWVLDFGAGNPAPADRFDHVVRQELLHYASTDVVSSTPRLPFQDACFDAIVCESVFEHVKEPFALADELYRVAKVGARIRVDSAFLQPYHADPDHYYNMTVQGLEHAFRRFRKTRSGVGPHQRASYSVRILLTAYRDLLRAPGQGWKRLLVEASRRGPGRLAPILNPGRLLGWTEIGADLDDVSERARAVRALDAVLDLPLGALDALLSPTDHERLAAGVFFEGVKDGDA